MFAYTLLNNALRNDFVTNYTT